MHHLYTQNPMFTSLLMGSDVASDEFPMDELAFELAWDFLGSGGELDAAFAIARAKAKLDELTDTARTLAATRLTLRERLDAISQALYSVEKLRGNRLSYYDPRNSLLPIVLDRRLGNPITLAVIYMTVARRLRADFPDMQVAGVNLPAHFCMVARHDPEPIFIDPFERGGLMNAGDCAALISRVAGRELVLAAEQFEPCSARLMAIRMLRNLKAIYLKRAQFHQALRAIGRLTALSPDDLAEQRDYGIVCLHAGRQREGINWLESYLETRPNPGDANRIRSLLRGQPLQ